MKIAVAYENGNVFEHFGHSRQFKIYETDGQNIVKEEVINNIEYICSKDILPLTYVQGLLCCATQFMQTSNIK